MSQEELISEVIEFVQNAPVSTVLIASGLLFILSGCVTKLWIIEVSKEQRKFIIPIGAFILTIGLVLNSPSFSEVNSASNDSSSTNLVNEALSRSEKEEFELLATNLVQEWLSIKQQIYSPWKDDNRSTAVKLAKTVVVGDFEDIVIDEISSPDYYDLVDFKVSEPNYVCYPSSIDTLQGGDKSEIHVDVQQVLGDGRQFATNHGYGLQYDNGQWKIADAITANKTKDGSSLRDFRQRFWGSGVERVYGENYCPTT